MTIALARKYRPRDFASVAVQSHVSNTLRNAIARDRVAPGYLLCGPRGTGKTTLARVLAMALNCERRLSGDGEPGEPCGECASCTRIWSGGASLDVVEIDAASNRGVDDARELRERAMYAPTGDERYKVYIVDEAHMLTREAWNALLKILEEPPPRVVFVFATTDPQKIAQAAAPVLSRLQRFDLKRIGPAEIRERLAHVLSQESVRYEPDALAMIARAADGGLRDALSLTDQVLSLGAESEVTATRVREALGLVAEEEYLTLLDLIAERRAADVFGEVGRLADAGVDFVAFLGGFTDVIRSLLAVRLGGSPPETSERMLAELQSRREVFSVADLMRMLQAIGDTETRFRRSGQQRMLLELLLVRLALLDRSVELEDVLRALGGEEGGGGGDRPARTPPPQPRSTGADGSASRLADSGALARTESREKESGAGGAPFARVAPESPARTGRTSTDAVATATTSAANAASATRENVVRSGQRPPLADGPPEWDGPPPWEDAPPEDADTSPRRAASGSGSRPSQGRAEPGRSESDTSAPIPDLHLVVERWDDVADAVRDAGRALVGTILSQSEPVSVTREGVLLVRVSDEPAEAAIADAMDEVLEALRSIFPGLRRVQLRRSGESAAALGRLTTEAVVAERIAVLKRRDPAVGEAIEELDLELIE